MRPWSGSTAPVPTTDSRALAGLLLEPFQRLGTTRTNDHSGYGLGLSIVQPIATAHHAQLTAQPGDGGGLDIYVSFPAPASSPKT